MEAPLDNSSTKRLSSHESAASAGVADTGEQANKEALKGSQGSVCLQKGSASPGAPGDPGFPMPLPLSLRDPWAAFEEFKETLEAMAVHCRLRRRRKPSSLSPQCGNTNQGHSNWQDMEEFAWGETFVVMLLLVLRVSVLQQQEQAAAPAPVAATGTAAKLVVVRTGRY